MAKYSRKNIYRVLIVLAILFAMWLIYTIFRRYSLKEGLVSGAGYEVKGKDNDEIYKNGKKIVYYANMDDGGKIYDKTDPKNGIYTGLLMSTDDVISSDSSDPGGEYVGEVAGGKDVDGDGEVAGEEEVDGKVAGEDVAGEDVAGEEVVGGEELDGEVAGGEQKKTNERRMPLGTNGNIYPSGKIYFFKRSNGKSSKGKETSSKKK